MAMIQIIFVYQVRFSFIKLW